MQCISIVQKTEIMGNQAKKQHPEDLEQNKQGQGSSRLEHQQRNPKLAPIRTTLQVTLAQTSKTHRLPKKIPLIKSA